MCKVISISNQKGGTSKTTLTVNLAVGLARKGKKVLVVDADPQGSATASLGFREPDALEVTISDVMTAIIEDEPIPENYGILHQDECIDLLPANISLAGIEVSLVNVMSRELILKNYLDTVRENYDVIIIDCMPSLGMLTINALACADEVIIPCQPTYLAVKGLEMLIKTIYKIRRQLNPRLEIMGILIAMADLRANYPKQLIKALKESYGDTLRIFESIIPMSVRAAETSAVGVSIYLHDPKGKVAKAYMDLTEEVLNYV